jgi:hypothetical protein
MGSYNNGSYNNGTGNLVSNLCTLAVCCTFLKQSSQDPVLASVSFDVGGKGVMACRATTTREWTTLVITTTVSDMTWLAAAILPRCMEYFNADNSESNAWHVALETLVYTILHLQACTTMVLETWERITRVSTILATSIKAMW